MRYLLAALLIYSAGVLPASAASSPDAIAYEYRAIQARYEVQSDSSVRVEERITIAYEGTYHALWRGISLGRVAVSDVAVLDADTGEVLRQVERFPDLPNDKANYGTYAWINDEGYFKAEWYYDVADTQKTWILRYTLRGAVAFKKEYDELSWSLFSRYAVPVGSVAVEVVVPEPGDMGGELTLATGTLSRPDERTLRFDIGKVTAGGGVGFVAHWQKGIVHPPLRSFVLTEFLLRYGLWPFVAVLALVLGAAGTSAYWWHKKRAR